MSVKAINSLSICSWNQYIVGRMPCMKLR